MAERSGSTGILGVIIGAVLVIALVFFLFGGFNTGDEVDVSVEEPAIQTPADDDTVTGTINNNPPATTDNPPAAVEEEEEVIETVPVEPAEPATPAQPNPQ